MAKGLFGGLFGRKKDKDAEPDSAGSAAENVETPGAEDGAPETAVEDAPVEPASVERARKDEASGEAFSAEEAAAQEQSPKQEPKQEPEHAVEPNIDAGTPAPDAAPAQPEEPETPEKKKKGLFSRLRAGLSRTSSKLSEGVASIFTKRKLDDEMLEELEELLISADLGVAAAGRVTQALSKGRFDKEIASEEVRAVLAEEIAKTLAPLEAPLAIAAAHKPHVILVAGVNGAGKTTTIGKLAKRFMDDGKSVMLAAGDTFRAAAIEQLQVWGERVGAPVVAKGVGADAAGLAYDAVKRAQDEGVDVLMIDTAGRLQNRRELMDELAKIVRVIRKLDPTAPHESLLVLDATVGQNALSQADAFTQVADVTGLIMTKLDGTARGGVLVALADKFSLPIHFIGVGESVEDLQPFDADAFARALAGAE